MNDVRLQAKLGSKNPTGLPVGVVRGGIFYAIRKTENFFNDRCRKT